MKIVHENDMPFEPALNGDMEEYVGISKMSITYIQEPDCTEDRDDGWQELTIEARDGGGGFFINLKTNSWSIEKPENLTKILEDFNQRLKCEK